MSSLRVAIRVDASAEIGLGHLMRCLALAHALRDAGAEVRFVARDLGIDALPRIAEAGFATTLLAPPRPGATPAPVPVPHAPWARVDAAVDAEETAAALRAAPPDAVVVDHYAFDAAWHRCVAVALGCRIVVVDDLADRDLRADLLVDHNLHPDHRAKYRGRIGDRTALLGGPRFALLAPAYAAAAPCTPGDPVRSIGVFMGGVDAAGFSSLALHACREVAGFAGPIEVVSPPTHAQAGALRELAARWPETRVLGWVPSLADFFARHDLQIGAGGGATWERCCLGAPTLALTAAANQRAAIDELARRGVVAVPEGPVGVDSVGRAVRELLADAGRRRRLGERSRALVDGLGARRVALRIAAATLVVRPATSVDAPMMHRWRDHPATRGVSRDPRPIPWVEHRRWLEHTLSDPRRLLLVGRIGTLDVGVIRFDRRDDGPSEVSLYLDPALHGLGLGRALLLAGEDELRRRHGAAAGIVATVLDDNGGSKRMFAGCGYRFAGGQWHKAPAPEGRTKELADEDR